MCDKGSLRLLSTESQGSRKSRWLLRCPEQMLFSLRALLASGAFLGILVTFAACGSDEPLPAVQNPNPGTLPDGAPIGDGGLLGDGGVVPLGPGVVSGRVHGRASLLPIASRAVK